MTIHKLFLKHRFALRNNLFIIRMHRVPLKSYNVIRQQRNVRSSRIGEKEKKERGRERKKKNFAAEIMKVFDKFACYSFHVASTRS